MVLRFIAMSFEMNKYVSGIASFLEIVAKNYTTKWKSLSYEEYTTEKKSMETKLKQTFEKLSSFALGKATFTLNDKNTFYFVEAVVCYLIQHPEVLNSLTKVNYDSFLLKATTLDQEKGKESPFSGGGKNTINYFKKRLEIVDQAFVALNE